ncbi:MAG: aspartyl/glutamyl-tRNA amidotransferase subunit C [Gemmatimonadales bacterium]|jgi:aspartyl/glutamyl-tRNA(Asn/Gln) amidotransferase C subunit|nr:aspartyl/glutamyl-tRNA amidotransferase subunit C [Gemmatimonadales bacterium]
MSIGRDEVLHVAKLAELAVRESELHRLVDNLNRIVNYVAALDEVPADRIAEPYLAGPQSVALREDVEAAMPLARPPASMAPEFAGGFYLVPRHGAMEDQ